MTQPKILHDGSFDIATGRSRKETNWKNKEMLWSELVLKLSKTHHTAETQSEYMASKKSRQDEIKDVGGFVGAFLTGGRRKSASVLHRQLITLDLDFASKEFWDDLQMYYGEAALVYSTHKHTPEHPRLRLIMPLDRPVRPDEYEAIARRIAGTLDIELFDPTTFQPERLMYWPSTSKGAEYEFHCQDGLWINADNILDTYVDWKDSSAWPVSVKVDTILQRSIAKQGDPLEKPGLIGAFCRTYDIGDAIDTYLSDVYDTCDIENRYSYKEGSTAAGLVVYDDKYAYSHHGTDPTSGKLCNAFDLVRIHKFGLKDDGTKEGTPNTSLPSYQAMLEFATKDTKVKKLLGSERLAEATEDFQVDPLEETDDDGDDEWMVKLEMDKKGNYYSTMGNVKTILENDPRLKGRFGTDEFIKQKVLLKNVPWRKVTHDARYLRDEDEQNFNIYLEKKYNITTRANIKDAFDTHIAANNFHPVRDYLSGLQWDNEKRVDTLLIEYMGAAENDYIRAVTRKALVAAVTRIFHPGAKFDYVLTMVGEEGLGKSSVVGKLGGEWFSDSFNFNMIHSGKAYEQIQGVWLIEMAELAGLRKADMESAKHFISKREDLFRKAYGRNVVNNKRQCVFFASTNNRDFLKDPTGNRRFWPVETHVTKPTKNVFTDLTQEVIDQVWAEAVALYRKKEPLFLSKQLEATARQVQKEHREIDGRIGIVEKYLNTLLPVEWDKLDLYTRRSFLKGDTTELLYTEGVSPRTRVCAAEIWTEALGGMERDINRSNTKEIHNIMREIDGWEEYKSRTVFRHFGNQKGYYKTLKNEANSKENTTSEKLAKTRNTTCTT